MIKGNSSAGARPDVDPWRVGEGAHSRSWGEARYPSAGRGSTPWARSSAGCEQRCHSARQGLAAALSNHNRACKLKRWDASLFLRVSQPQLSLKYRLRSYSSCLSQWWSSTVKLIGSISLLWKAAVLKPFYWYLHGFLAASLNFLKSFWASKNWQNGIWNKEVMLARWEILSIGGNCTQHRNEWGRYGLALVQGQ